MLEYGLGDHRGRHGMGFRAAAEAVATGSDVHATVLGAAAEEAVPVAVERPLARSASAALAKLAMCVAVCANASAASARQPPAAWLHAVAAAARMAPARASPPPMAEAHN